MPHTDPTDFTDFFVGGKSHGGSPPVSSKGSHRFNGFNKNYSGDSGVKNLPQINTNFHK